MTGLEILWASLATAVTVFVIYRHCGLGSVWSCYMLWFRRDYWNSYNIIEAVSWLAKALVIVPGLIFHIHIWQLYWITLLTSVALIWVSNHKLLPTLVGFNTIWIFISFMVIAQNIL